MWTELDSHAALLGHDGEGTLESCCLYPAVCQTAELHAIMILHGADLQQ